MRDLDSQERAQVLRYAELAFRSARGPLADLEQQELESIRQALGLTHEEILALAEQGLTGSGPTEH